MREKVVLISLHESRRLNDRDTGNSTEQNTQNHVPAKEKNLGVKYNLNE